MLERRGEGRGLLDARGLIKLGVHILLVFLITSTSETNFKGLSREMNYNVQQLQIDVIYTINKTRQFYDLEGESISVYNVFNRKLSH